NRSVAHPASAHARCGAARPGRAARPRRWRCARPRVSSADRAGLRRSLADGRTGTRRPAPPRPLRRSRRGRPVRAAPERCRASAPGPAGPWPSGEPGPAYPIAFHARVGRGLCRAVALDEPLGVGNSVGGQIALELALAEPGWIRALVLTAPAQAARPRAL